MSASTPATVDLTAPNNATFQDAFQFDPDGTWTLVGQSFHMEVKASAEDAVALASWTSAGGTIVVDSTTDRIIHMNVSEAALLAALPVGEYVYDLVMFDASVPPIRTLLMQGALSVTQGVTES